MLLSRGALIGLLVASASLVSAQTTNYRSIGTAPGNLYATGTATVPLGGTTVTFSGCLPSRIGQGDVLTVGGETLFILSRTSSTQVTLQAAATINHPGQAFTITRAHNTLAAWHTARGGNLVAGNRVEVGVAYNDGPFTAGVTITANSDATRYMRLTVAPFHRHDGTAGTGVVLDGGNLATNGITVQSDFAVVEWFELIRHRGANNAAAVAVQNATGVVLQNLLVHNFLDNAFTVLGVRAGNNSNFSVRNSVFYDGGGAVGNPAAIRGNGPVAANTVVRVQNCTVHGMAGAGARGVFENVGTFTVTNTISMASAVDFSVVNGTQSYNMSSDASAAGTGSLTGRLPANQFASVVAGSEDFHLKGGAQALDTGTDLSVSFTADADGDGRPGLSTAWDMGADERPTSVYRSIGMNAGTLYGTGTATVALGAKTVTFGGGANLPANVGMGDALTVGGETLYVLQRVSATAVTLQTPALAAHPGQAYAITRAHGGAGGFQAWETARQGNLVASNRVEVGVVYNDAPFVYSLGNAAVVTIDGSTTDAQCYMKLTVAQGHRHTGTAGTGVYLDGSANTKFGVEARDDYTVVEGLEFRGFHGTGLSGAVSALAGARSVLFRGLLIHSFYSTVSSATGVRVFVGSTDPVSVTVRNCSIFNGDEVGIENGDCDAQVTVQNTTVYNMRDGISRGVHVSSGGGATIATNTVSMGNAGGDFTAGGGTLTQSYNMSSDATAAGTGSLTGQAAATQFISTTTGAENLHLKAGATAIDVASNLTASASFVDDIDLQTRPTGAGWDMGSDEYTGLPRVGTGCSAPWVPTGPNFVSFGDFSGGATPALNNFTASIPFTAFVCPGDTGQTIRTTTGFCSGTSVTITPFPGDPLAGVAATANSLYTNGNSTGGAMIIWRQTVAGLQPNTAYTFYLYGSNSNNGGVTQPPILPSLRFCKGVAGAGPYSCVTQLNPADFTLPNETAASGDYWTRFQVAFTTGAGETTADLAILDAATNTNGDDVQITRLGVQACAPLTAVSLLSFDAVALDGAVSVSWTTGSEVNNLGFNLYRSKSETGPWQRVNGSIVPGKGFSAIGSSYGWLDQGLQNGVAYHYRLEDIDSRTGSTFHGPVSAVPLAASGGTPQRPAREPGARAAARRCPAWALGQLGESASSYACETFGGDPAAASLRVVSRTAGSVVVELETPGFVAARDASGRVRALVAGFDSLLDPQAPALPLKRAWIDGVVGRKAVVRSVAAKELQAFERLLPAAVGFPQALVGSDGTVRPGRRDVALRLRSRGLLPAEQARLAGEAFLGDQKRLTLELTPLRFDAARGALVLARRLQVRIDFSQREPREVGRGRRGRRLPDRKPEPAAQAFLATSALGLHAVAFEAVFPGRTKPLDAASLRLTRERGTVLVPFRVEPGGASFGPGSRLVSHAAARPRSTDFSPETVYALATGGGGSRMPVVRAAPSGAATGSHGFAEWETNRIYVGDNLGAEDLWQWETMLGGVSVRKSFSLAGLDAASPAPARLVVRLQGVSDAPSVVDHHVQAFVNGALVGEARFDGKTPQALAAELPVSLLRQDVANELTLTNVGDTGVPSGVNLDRFEVEYPQTASARAGRFDGAFAAAGTGEIAGLLAPAALVDATSGAWLTGYEAGATLRFRTEAAHRYVAVSEEALLAPRVSFLGAAARLKDAQNHADYLLVAPQAFLAAAEPLLARRAAQGLATFAASLEEIAAAFGGGQPSAAAVREFLAFAYQGWRQPSPRYVLLLGDANSDPRGFLASSQPSPLPFLLQKTSYMWTASDPVLAAVNGDDLLPDLAIGRLPAASVEQAQAMVAKVLDWEDRGPEPVPQALLVADNPDAAGDFEANARDIESSFLQGWSTRQLFLSQTTGALARSAILDAFNEGLSIVDYVGHGGGAVWASENILNSWDMQSLLAQPRQPLMLTMNCLNGYFVAPSYDSLAEAFLKADGRGTIAAFSPSGLSLDEPAHLLHRAIVEEITSGRHERLGDAVLAAQLAYAGTGAFPELLSIYHLLGDPALRLR